MIYLLHSSVPVGTSGRNSAQHYLGWTPDGQLHQRLADHRTGRGAAITRAYVRSGGTLYLVLTVAPGTRTLERQLKRRGHLERLCGLCNPRLATLGKPVSMEQLCHLRKQSAQQSTKLMKASGGVSSPGKPTGNATSSLHEPNPATATGSDGGREPSATTPGGGATSAIAKRTRRAGTWRAGTKRRASWRSRESTG